MRVKSFWIHKRLARLDCENRLLGTVYRYIVTGTFPYNLQCFVGDLSLSQQRQGGTWTAYAPAGGCGEWSEPEGCSIFSESFAAALGCSVGDCPYTGNDIRKGFARSTTHQLSDVYFACTAASTTTTTRNVLTLIAMKNKWDLLRGLFVVDFQPL